MTGRACAICAKYFKARGGFRTCSWDCSEQLKQRRNRKYRKESEARRRDRYLSDSVYKAKVKAQRIAVRRAQAEQRKSARFSKLPSAKTIAVASRCRQQNPPLRDRKKLAADLICDDPKQSNATIAWATGISTPTVREIRLSLERRREIEVVIERVDKLGRTYPATRLPNRGRLVGTETFAQRAVARAFLKVGALRTLEIVLAQLPSAVDLAATPYSRIECEHLALSLGSRNADHPYPLGYSAP
jgi:hypothetical protein